MGANQHIGEKCWSAFFKDGNNSDVTDYRSIALFSCIFESFEKKIVVELEGC